VLALERQLRHRLLVFRECTHPFGEASHAMRRKRLGSVLFVLLLCLVVAIGFSRGWFQLSSSEDATHDQVHVDLTLDRGKFQSDAEKAVDKTRQEASKLSDSIKRGTSEGVHDKTPPAQP
jgi:cell division protein FtsX